MIHKKYLKLFALYPIINILTSLPIRVFDCLDLFHLEIKDLDFIGLSLLYLTGLINVILYGFLSIKIEFKIDVFRSNKKSFSDELTG